MRQYDRGGAPEEAKIAWHNKWTAPYVISTAGYQLQDINSRISITNAGYELLGINSRIRNIWYKLQDMNYMISAAEYELHYGNCRL